MSCVCWVNTTFHFKADADTININVLLKKRYGHIIEAFSTYIAVPFMHVTATLMSAHNVLNTIILQYTLQLVYYIYICFFYINRLLYCAVYFVSRQRIDFMKSVYKYSCI